MFRLVLVLFGCAEPAAVPRTEALVVAAPSEVPAPPYSSGALIYVPVYSSVFIGEGDKTLDLTVTLSVRNLDRTQPITVTRADFHDAGGRLVHAYVASPTPIPPLGSAEIVVRETDTRAGVGGCFLVAWGAAADASEPMIQAVMIGTSRQQGISFVSDGRVLERSPDFGSVGPSAR